MSRFSKGRNNAFFEQRSASGIAVGGAAVVVPKAFQTAKKTGTIQLSSKGIENIDPALFIESTSMPSGSGREINYSFDAQSDPRFWEEATIQKIDMSFNKIRSIPLEIGTLMDLTILNMRSNRISKFPVELCSCTKLKIIDFGQNEIPRLPEQIHELTELKELLLNNNNLEVIPDSIGACASLSVLNVDANSLATLPDSICRLTNLTQLVVSKNRLQILPPAVTQLRSIVLLDCHKNKIHYLPDLCGLSSLTHLDARDNCISDFPSLPSSGSLSQILLSFNRINRIENLPSSSILALQNVVELHLNNNTLRSIPDAICLMRNAKRLEFSNNEITEVPFELGYIDTLNQLGLDGNPLRSIRRTLISQATQDLKKYLRTRGPPPAWYSAEEQCDPTRDLLERARDLAGGALDLSSSGLTFLPSEVADMLSVISREGDEFRKVSSVLLSKNKFLVVPSELSMLKLLRELDISDNKLGLSAPESLRSMILPALKVLNVSRNGLISLALEAIIDSLGDAGALLSAFIADGNQLERFPRNLRNIYSLRELSFANNLLKTIDGDLRCLEKIEVLNLSSNSLEEGLDRILPLSTLSSLLLDNNNLPQILPEIGAMPNLLSITLHGNPQRTVRSNIIQQGPGIILRYLKDKIIQSSMSTSTDTLACAWSVSEVQSLQADVEALETRLLDRSISNSKMFALKKELAMKKASLIRLRRQEESL